MKRAAIYTRISVLNEAIDKTANQEDACRKFAAAKNYEVTAVYCDDGISATNFKARPAYLRVLADAVDSKFDCIIAVAEDRLSREPMEKLQLLAACGEGSVTIDTIRDGFVNPADDEAELFSYFRGWSARKEQRVKSARQKAANAALVLSLIHISEPTRPY